MRRFSDLPIAVGFGISKPEHVADVWRYADAAVVGSAIVDRMEKAKDSDAVVKDIGDFTASLITRK
jgi:tryptophan synthase alpha chain